MARHTDYDKIVDARVGETTEVVVEGEMPSTGYVWLLVNVFPQELQLVGTDFHSYSSNPEVVGAGGDAVFRFLPTQAGEYHIGFVLKRPWLRNDSGIRRFDVLVRVTRKE